MPEKHFRKSTQKKALQEGKAKIIMEFEVRAYNPYHSQLEVAELF